MMKATKTGLKKFFEDNKHTQFIFKTITKYYDTNNNLIVSYEDESEPQQREIKQVTPTYIRFYGSNLEISKHLQVRDITEDYAIVSYPGYETTISKAHYEGVDYDEVKKVTEKIITYKK